jgi:RNA polymerase sigma factor (sigma-70 family)
MDNAAERFTELYQTHGAMFWRMAMRVLHSPEDADDTLQEALLRAWKQRDQFREDANLATWVYRIVWNTALEHYRKNAASPSYWAIPLDDSLPEADSTEADSTLETLERESQRQLALELVKSLPPRQCECLGAILRGEPVDLRLSRNKVARHWGLRKVRRLLASRRRLLASHAAIA